MVEKKELDKTVNVNFHRNSIRFYDFRDETIIGPRKTFFRLLDHLIPSFSPWNETTAREYNGDELVSPNGWKVCKFGQFSSSNLPRFVDGKKKLSFLKNSRRRERLAPKEGRKFWRDFPSGENKKNNAIDRADREIIDRAKSISEADSLRT